MRDAFHAIWDVHQAKKVPLRTAAFIKALQRVTRVRTWFFSDGKVYVELA